MKRALADADKTTKDLESSVSELINENKIYRGLATIGIAAAVFGHETQTSISAVSAAVSAIKAVTESIRPNIGILKRELSKAEKYASQVSAWGAFALTRIQRDKRTSKQTNVKNLIDEILDFLKPVYEAINITIQRKINTVEGKVFPIDIEAIILNLLTNAYTFCQQEQRTRNIRVELNAKGENNRKGFEIIVADSGPGVSSKLAHRVWEPLYSTRTDEQGKEIGTGLGLSIVKSIVDELNGEKSVEYDSDLKGAKFVIWLPLEK